MLEGGREEGSGGRGLVDKHLNTPVPALLKMHFLFYANFFSAC